ncbi:MAG: shikimate kinase [Fimbriimonadaceae bacterium]|nr:shikimate kinase [Fimbriimonadaceae bacterium]
MISLVGMMGAGKTTVGRCLAARLDVSFYDLDRLIEHSVGHRVQRIFDLFGEETFRKHETRAITDLPKGDGVLALGGGAYIRESNRPLIHSLGPVVWIRVSREILLPRLERNRMKRPLLAQEDWKEKVDELMAKREPVYAGADIIVEGGDEDPDEVAARIQEALK